MEVSRKTLAIEKLTAVYTYIVEIRMRGRMVVCGLNNVKLTHTCLNRRCAFCTDGIPDNPREVQHAHEGVCMPSTRCCTNENVGISLDTNFFATVATQRRKTRLFHSLRCATQESAENRQVPRLRTRTSLPLCSFNHLCLDIPPFLP